MLKTITSISSAIDANLKKAMYGVIAMWGGVLAVLISFVLELALEAAAAGTGAGAPPAALAAVASTGKVITFALAAVAAFTAYLGTVIDSVTTLSQTLQTGTRGGVWPAAHSTEFNDGSLSDGDNSGWRYKNND